MDLVTGCPDEAMLALAEVAMLAHWKAMEQGNNTLSYRELVRRGDDVEGRLRRRQSGRVCPSPVEQAPLHPNVPPTGTVSEVNSPFPNEETRRLVAKLFCEAAVLFLNLVLSDATPGAHLGS